MSTFLQKVHTAMFAEAHEVADKLVDMNSIPNLKENIRELETAQLTLATQAAAAAANVGIQTSRRDSMQTAIDHDTLVIKAFLNKTPADEKSARVFATKVEGEKTQLTILNQQIGMATQQSQQFDTTVERLKNKHAELMNRVKVLTMKDNATRGLNLGSHSLQVAQSMLNTDGVDGSVDNVADRIDEKNAVAQETFNRTVASMEPPPDPLKDQAVDDLLNSLRTPAPETATAKA